MAQYVVQLDHAAQNQVMFNGIDSIVVEAASVAEARAMASSQFAGDSDAVWALATATLVEADADFEGWTFRVVVGDPGTADIADESYVGAAADTLDLMGAGIAALLAAHAELTTTYTAGTQVLEVATIGDGIGDHKLNFWFIPPSGYAPGVATMVASSVDEGIAAAILTITLVADGPTIPKVTALLRS